MFRSACASGVSIALLAVAGGCGGSSGSSPAQFPTQALGVCTKIAPRVKTTTSAVQTLDSSAGSSLSKLPQLAMLLGQLSTELSDLHSGLSGLSPPSTQKAAFDVFLADLKRLQDLTRTGAGYLKAGTIAGLQKFQGLSAELGTASKALSTDGAQVPGLAACKNVGK